MQESRLGWLAGILDGEGSITTTINNGVTRPLIQVVNTNQAILLEVQAILASIIGRNVYICLTKPGKGGNRDCYRLYVTKQAEVKIVLEMVIPYLVGKREAAILLLQYVENRLAKRATGKAFNYTQEDRDMANKIQSISSYRTFRQSVESGGVGNRDTAVEGAFRTAKGLAEAS